MRKRTFLALVFLALVGVGIVIALVIGVFVPRFAAPLPTPVMLQANAPIAHPDGIRLELAYEGVAPFDVRLHAVPRQDLLDRKASAEWEAAMMAVPDNLTLKSPIYSAAVETARELPLTVYVDLPTGAGDSDMLALYQWDGKAWTFLSGRYNAESEQLVAQADALPLNVAAFEVAAPEGIMLWGVVWPRDDFDPAAALDVVMPYGWSWNGSALEGAIAQGIAPSDSYRVMPYINGDPTESPEDAVRAIVEQVEVNAFDGAAWIYRPGTPDSFLFMLGDTLRARDKAFAVALTPGAVFGADLDVLRRAADWVLVQAALSDETEIERAVTHLLDGVPRDRVGYLTSAMSRSILGETVTSGGGREILGNLGTLSGVLPEDRPLQPEESFAFNFIPASSLSATWEKGSVKHELGTARALAERLALAKEMKIGAAGVVDLFDARVVPGAEAALAAFRGESGIPAEDLAVFWRVRDSAGATVQEAAGESLQVAALPTGDYAVEVGVKVGQGAEYVLETAEVSVRLPTETPTPTFTPSPTPTPTQPPTATPTAIPPTNTPQPEAPPANNPDPIVPSGSIGGNFEIGGQVNGFSYPNLMQYAGMTWVKRQAHHHQGANAGGTAGLINDAHAKGFKILLSVLGDRTQVTNEGYMDQYAGFVGGLAAAGADAIEIWNEHNLDREWPAGQIDPAVYTKLLAKSYNAIKAANPSTMVISGAPSPTGAEGFFGLDKVWNDDRYIRGMAEAGAAQYMDCVGVHYNEGITSPSLLSGDPRDDYYTRYFQGMINVYWNAFGGARPLCFTELGYLSPEGYGALPGHFGWAGDVTVAQQAAWLVEAALIASASGKVRLMIIWNVDFTYWGADDPQAGYAIIRPGGGCPACDALSAITP